MRPTIPEEQRWKGDGTCEPVYWEELLGRSECKGISRSQILTALGNGEIPLMWHTDQEYKGLGVKPGIQGHPYPTSSKDWDNITLEALYAGLFFMPRSHVEWFLKHTTPSLPSHMEVLETITSTVFGMLEEKDAKPQSAAFPASDA